MREQGVNGKRYCWEGHDAGSAEMPLWGIREVGVAAGPGDTVVITEGVPAARALRERGVRSVATLTGAGAIPCDESLQDVLQYDTVLWPDSGAKGERHMLRIGQRLLKMGGSPRLVRWDDAPGDEADAADFSGTDGELRDLIDSATPLTAGNVGNLGGLEFEEANQVGSLGLVRLSDVEPQEVEWLWDGRLPAGKIIILDGDPGLGKSTLALDIAARLTTGRLMPNQGVAPMAVPAHVILLTAEDGLADTIRPRFDAAGGDASRLHVLEWLARDGGAQRAPTVQDIDELRIAIHRTAARLVIVDPLFAHVPVGHNTHVDADVRQVLGPLSRLADETKCSFLAIRHFNKADGMKAMYRGGGSIGITAAARVALVVAENPDNPEQRVLAIVKNNLAPIPQALAYRIVDEDGVPRIRWEGPTGHSANDLLAIPDEPPDALEEAEQFLQVELEGGPVRSTVLFKRAAAEDIAKRTLQRAKRRLGVRARKTSADGPWVWEPPDQERH